MTEIDRRLLLGGLLGAAAAPALAQGYGKPAAPGPAFPPPDARTVLLVGDDVPRDPASMSARLAALAAREARDSYLAGGAVERLETAFAAYLGKEACAFFPTGTLANNVALRVLCGDNHHALCQAESHLYRDESDAAERMSGINLVPLAAGRAAPTLAEVQAAFDAAEKGPYPLKVGALAIESPVRRQAGELVPAETVRALAGLCAAHGTPMHLDAARLMLAPPSLDVKAYVAPFETVYVSLYKYLGAPFGAVLAGPAARIAAAREWRHLYGGLIYQGWAPALLAMDGFASFPAAMARAHAAGDALVAALSASGRVRPRANPHASNIIQLEMSEADAAAAFERGRAANVRVAKWADGAVPLYVNASILRRPVPELARVFTG
jgi:threonine aldolase